MKSATLTSAPVTQSRIGEVIDRTRHLYDILRNDQTIGDKWFHPFLHKACGFEFCFTDWDPTGVYFRVREGVNRYWPTMAKRIQAGYDNLPSHFYIVVGSANYIAYSVFLEVTDELEDLGLLSEKDIKARDEVTRMYQRYVKIIEEELTGAGKLESTYGRANLWHNMTMLIQDILYPDIVELRKHTQHWLKKHKAEGDLDVMAACLVVSMMFEAAVTVFRDFFKVTGKEWLMVLDVSHIYKEAEFTPLMDKWGEIEKSVANPNHLKGIATDKHVRGTYVKILHKMVDHETINAASTKAISYDPKLKALLK